MIDYDEDIQPKFHQGALIALQILEISACSQVKLEKIGPTFSLVNPCPFLSSIATDDRKHFYCINIVVSNKNEPLFFSRIQLMKRHI